MSALDGVLADLIEADCDCAYVTIKREPLEALIHEWARRGDQVTLFCGLLTRARDELTQAWDARAEQPHSTSLNASRESTLRALDAAVAESASAVAHHRHAVRRELAARLKLVLRAAISDIGVHVTDALLAGNTELAERLESERQTVRIVISTIDAVVCRLLQDELMAASISRG
ncbi:MAG TPA: hypothetical protein VG897_02815 [Terriglobales bacterium]|nr:hypothetical protein [Terriglobales bacterium]